MSFLANGGRYYGSDPILPAEFQGSSKCLLHYVLGQIRPRRETCKSALGKQSEIGSRFRGKGKALFDRLQVAFGVSGIGNLDGSYFILALLALNSFGVHRFFFG